jgi:putative glutamine amidotransferase
MRPLIGVPCFADRDLAEGHSPRYAHNRAYVECLWRAGGAVVLIPPATDPDLLRPIYESLDGLLLSGGGDIQPHLYRQDVQAQLVWVDPERDVTELEMNRWALEDGLPVLAICRGLQVLNVACGGTLIQDIPTQWPGALAHRPAGEQPRWQPQHEVQLVPGSRLARIMGATRPVLGARVNSFHHQAAAVVPAALRVAAQAPDGVVEAIESPDRAFVLGVQWHPEEMAGHDAAQQTLFAAFVEACRTKRRG